MVTDIIRKEGSTIVHLSVVRSTPGTPSPWVNYDKIDT